MKQKDNEEEKEDYFQIPKETISLTSLFIFVGIIFFLLVGMLFYLRYSSWSPLSNYYIKIPKAISLPDLFNKQKSSGSSISDLEIKMTESDLAEAIGVNNSNFPLKKASLKIKPEGIIISGKTSSGFWGITIDVVYKPVVINSTLNFEIKEIKAAGVVAPPKLANSLTPKMQGIFASAFSSTGDLKVSEARTLVGYMIVTLIK